MRSPARRLMLVLAAALATLPLLAGTATAQSSPASDAAAVDHAVTLASPGVVFIDTSVKVKGRVIFQNSNAVSGLGSISKTYSFDFATGSGFVVAPGGVVVTASHVVEPPEQEMRNYAANRLVLEGYGYDYPSAGSSPFEQYTLPVGYQNQLLQQCYRAVACTFDISPILTVYSAVDVAQSQLPKGAPARVLTSTGFQNTDVAVLQVNGTNMPTVVLGDSAGDLSTGADLVALGFPGTSRDALQTGVTQPNKVFGKVSNIRPQGTSNLIEVDANIEPGMSGGPAIDSSGRVVGLVSFSLVQSSGESGAKYLRTIDDINAALSSAGVTPARGPVDAAFEKAMDLFWGNHFTAAAPALQRVLDVYPGHPLATQFLAEAQAKAGTKADIPVATPTPAKGGGFPVWIIAAIAVLAVVVIVLVMQMRRKRPAPAVAGGPATAPLSAVGAPSAPAAERTVGFTPTPAATSPTGTAPPAPAAAPVTPVVPAPPVTSASAGETGTSTQEQPAPADDERPRFCPSCGHVLSADAAFCPSCGHKVEA